MHEFFSARYKWIIIIIIIITTTTILLLLFLLLLLIIIILLLLLKIVTVSPRGLTFWWWECYGLCHRHKSTKLAHSFLLCSCVCFCLYGPFDSISFHKFSRQLFAFSLRSSGLNSALLVLSKLSISL